MNEKNRVGVFSTLTNSYALVALGASENFYRYGRETITDNKDTEEMF